MKFTTTLSTVFFVAGTVHACSPGPGYKPPTLRELMQSATFIATGTVVNENAGIANPNSFTPLNFAAKMTLDCIIKTDGKTNRKELLNGQQLVGPFAGSAACSVNAVQGQRYMIFFHQEPQNGLSFLKLEKNGLHNEAIAVPADAEILDISGGQDPERWVFQGFRCPKRND